MSYLINLSYPGFWLEPYTGAVPDKVWTLGRAVLTPERARVTCDRAVLTPGGARVSCGRAVLTPGVLE